MLAWEGWGVGEMLWLAGLGRTSVAGAAGSMGQARVSCVLRSFSDSDCSDSEQ